MMSWLEGKGALALSSKASIAASFSVEVVSTDEIFNDPRKKGDEAPEISFAQARKNLVRELSTRAGQSCGARDPSHSRPV